MSSGRSLPVVGTDWKLGIGELRADADPFDNGRGCNFSDIRFIPGLSLGVRGKIFNSLRNETYCIAVEPD